jgi:magnesium-transporting ATPase (P-type)
VIRDGVEKRVAGAEVVRGDVIILAEGDRISADGTVLATHDLQCDESLLTGEAVPVRKIASPGAPPARPGGDDLPYVYSGSLVVRGHGQAEITATGARSEIGKIGLAITRIELKIESVVDRGMHAEEALSGSSRFEPLHLALSSPYRLMRILGAIVLPEPLFMRAGQP